MKRSEYYIQMRERLEQRKRELISILNKAGEAQRALGGLETELEEQAQKESMFDVLERLDNREEEEIEAIDAALSRIKMGSYGFCEICKKPIAFKRLDAIPWTCYCSVHAG